MDIKLKLDKEGYNCFENDYNNSFCDEVKEFMDEYNGENIENLYGDTEKRIWDANLRCSLIEKYKKECDEQISDIYNVKIESKTILALKNIPIPKDGTQIKGRWHIDSFRKQVKKFTFLSDVQLENGPFEFIPGSHLEHHKKKQAIRGKYFGIFDFFKKTRKYQSLEEKYIERIQNKMSSMKVLCNAGDSYIIDTSAVHRASPCIEGKRYYLCAYYDHF